MISPELRESYAYSENLARREAGNFYHAFRILPHAQRQAMCALYAFMRIADDLSDGSETVDLKRSALADYRAELRGALQGEWKRPLFPALIDTVQTFQIPVRYLEEVIDGVEMDLTVTSYGTFQDLYKYCYRVASAVGLCCIHVWGFDDQRALVCAESAGIAFQLTNILRDLREDADRGRIYIPQEDLAAYGYDQQDLRQGLRNDAFRNLMQFEVARAHRYYEQGEALQELLKPAGRAVFSVMLSTYRGILREIERRDFDVFRGRVRLSRWRKLALVLRALPLRWGWV